MVDDDLVAAIRTEGCLDGLGYGSTCFYISYYSTVFGFVTVVVLVEVVLGKGRGENTFGILA